MTEAKGINAFMRNSSLALLSLVAIASATAGERSRNPLADHVRAANDRFKNVSVAVSEGYSPIPCASGIAGGAMGGAFADMNPTVSCDYASAQGK